MAKEGGYWERFWRSQVGRRQVLKAGAVGGAGLMAAVAVGCAEEEKPTAAPAAAPAPPAATAGAAAAKQPKRGGQILRAGGQGGSLDTGEYDFDPHVDTFFKALGHRLMYQGLLGYDSRTYEVKPELAQKWEQPSPTEFVLKLQPGVKWHNKPPVGGRALTVQDVVFSLERVRTNNPRFTAGQLLAGVKFEAADGATLKVATPKPDATFLTKLSGDPMLVLAREALEKAGGVDVAGKVTTAELAVGTGGFIITSMQEKVKAEYVRNPDYWKPGLPYLDRLGTRHFDLADVAYAAFSAGQVDIANILGKDAKAYIARQGPGYTPDWYNSIALGGFANPNVKVKPFDDARVTRALRLLIDPSEFIKAWAEPWYGGGGFASIFPPSLQTWDLTQEEYARLIFWKQPKDEAAKEALALFSAAGFTRDTPLRFEMMGLGGGPFEAMAVLLQSQFKRLGQGVVDVTKLNLFEGVAFQTVRAKRDFAYASMVNAAVFNDPEAWLTPAYRTGGGRNYMNYSDAKLDALIDKQAVTFAAQERKAVVKEIIRYMAETSPGVMYSSRRSLNALKPQIRNYAPEEWLNGQQYEQIWLDV